MNHAVTVIGSYNVGLFLKGEVIPAVGQTVIGDKFYEGGGGKGSNQAVACAKMGAPTVFIGRIGNDQFGKDALAMYQRFGMTTEKIKVDATIHSGISVIFIDKDGQNSIMCIPGANFNLSKADIDEAMPVIKNSCIVGFQLETNFDVVAYGIAKANQAGIRTLLDPAPAFKLPEEIYPSLYYIKPNEHEATILTGIKVTDVESAKAAGRWFLSKGVNTAIITLGEKGAVLISQDGERHFDTPQVPVADTTGAGDCFSGALMAALSKGESIADAILFANYASAISVTRYGVVDAIPEYHEVAQMLDSVRKAD